MVIATGVDIVKIERLRRIVIRRGEKFLRRNFTPKEIDYCNKKVNKFQHLSGRFASKEAISKALKLKWAKGLNWKQIEIVNNRNAEPMVKLAGQAKGAADNLKVENLYLSISHCQEYAVAMVVITGANNGTVTRDY